MRFVQSKRMVLAPRSQGLEGMKDAASGDEECVMVSGRIRACTNVL